MDAHGGWLVSVLDLARFAAAFTAPSGSPLLSPAAQEEMFARPSGEEGKEVY